ncbi:MAG: hypothetical protein IJP00_00305 [Firmicutes bacterium]|nr:hypothetical protein [Bacillota bacterium]
MKDLITTIAAVVLLMIFVMQFANNQMIFSRITAADKAIDNFQCIAGDNWRQDSKKEELKLLISECLDCDASLVEIEEDGEKMSISAPVKNVVACNEILGIDDDKSVFIYRKGLWKSA